MTVASLLPRPHTNPDGSAGADRATKINAFVDFRNSFKKEVFSGNCDARSGLAKG